MNETKTKVAVCVGGGILSGFLAVALAVTLTGLLTNTCDCHSLEHEYKDLMFEYKALSAEYARLQYQCSGIWDLQESYSTTTAQLPYYVPVDIQEPLPYVPGA